MADDSLVLDGTKARRARKACLSCRTRKIKCNVEQQGPPCSNCLNDGIRGCRTVESLRGKRLRTSTDQPAGPAPALVPIEATPTTGSSPPAEPEATQTTPLGRPQVSPTHTTGWLEDIDEPSALQITTPKSQTDQTPQHSSVQVDPRFLHQELSYAGLVGNVSVRRLPSAAPTPPRSLITRSAESHIQSPASHTHPRSTALETNRELPGFISPLPPSISQVDLDHLRVKGALDIPSADFLKSLINAFVQYVHPYAPVIDLSCLVGVLDDDRGCMGILLFQSMAFIAVSYVDISHIRRAGFTSRRACRKAFYEKARLLYDNDVEVDKLATVQATLLLSYWADTPGDNRGCWYWLGIAVTLAQILGLHRRAECRVETPQSRLRKRVWWACYLRDRIMGMAIGRPLRIRDFETSTPPLTLEDFEIVELSRVFDGDVEPSPETQVALAELCIQAMELCRIGTKVLELHFSMLPGEKRLGTTSQEDNGATTAMVFLKDDVADEQLVRQLDEQLQSWYQGLPVNCVYKGSDSQRSRPRCLVAGAASLNITFWTVVSTLQRPQLRQKNSAASIRRVGKAAIEVSRINRQVHTSRLDRHLIAAAGISFQHTPFIIHTKRLANSTARGEVTEILDSLFYCIKVLETARDSFPGADTGLGFMLTIARRARLTLLFDQDSKLWGISYQGVHYSPGSQQLSLDSSERIPAASFPSTPAVGPFGSHFDPAPFPDSFLNSPSSGQGRHDMDLELSSFEHMDAIDLSSIADFLPAGSLDYELSLGWSTNFHDYVHDVEMGDL